MAFHQLVWEIPNIHLAFVVSFYSADYDKWSCNWYTEACGVPLGSNHLWAIDLYRCMVSVQR